MAAIANGAAAEDLFADQTAAQELDAESVRLMRHGLINVIGPLLSGVAGVVVIPVMLHGLGPDLYGLWIVCFSVVAWCAAVADMGLSWTVIREVGGAGARKASIETTARLVATAANCYLAIALAGALIISVLSLPIVHLLTASKAVKGSLPVVLLFIGAGFAGNQMLYFELSLLRGMRRFDLSNLLSTLSAFVSAVAIIGVIWLGGGLASVAVAHAFSAAIAAFAAYQTVIRVEPRYRQWACGFDWSLLRTRLRFSLMSQAMVWVNTVLWEGPPMLIGLMLGAAAVVPYHLGRRFPMAVGWLSWTAGSVAMPAASEHEQAGDAARLSRAFQSSTRWVIVSTMPLFVVLWIIGPNLLRVWLGTVPPESTAVLRLLTVAVILDAVSAAANGVLLGCGAAGVVLAIVSIQTVAAALLAFGLLARFGVCGVAWALVLAMPMGAFGLLSRAGRTCGFPLKNLPNLLAGFWVPIAVCAAAAELIIYVLQPAGWLSLGLTAAASGLVYAFVFYLYGARREERVLVEEVIESMRTGGVRTCRALSKLGRGLGFHLHRYPRLAALADVIRDPCADPSYFEREFALRPDPWNYLSSPGEIKRHQIAAELLDAVRKDRRFDRALEIGCAEGVFTEILAARCDSLLAVDFSPLALERARQRTAWKAGVSFAQWDLRRDAVPGYFDLIVAMDVLSVIRRPGILRTVFEKLIGAMRPGDLLLAGDFRYDPVFEVSWLGKFLLRGGKRVIDALACDPRLEAVQEAGTGTHVFALLRRR